MWCPPIRTHNQGLAVTLPSPVRRLMRWRLLRVLAVVALVPVVVFSNPTQASAAASGLIGYDFGDVSCQVSWTMPTDTSMFVSPRSRCDGGLDLTPSACQNYEGGCGSWAWVIKDGLGGTCASTPLGSGSNPTPDDSVRHVSYYLDSGSLSLVPGCLPAQACLSYYWNGAGGFNAPGPVDEVRCAPIDVDMPEVESECIHGTPQVPKVRVELTNNGSLSVASQRVYVSGVGPLVAPPLESGKPRPGWNWSTIMAQDADGQNYRNAPTVEGYKDTRSVNFITSDGPPTLPLPYGVEVWWVDPGHLDWYPNSWDDQYGTVRAGVAPAPGYDMRGFLGVTDPTQCRFYFGTKLRDLPGTDVDEPVAPLTEPPPPVAPEPETPDEEGNWWWVSAVLRVLNSIVGAIGRIVSAIFGLADDIVRGIADALSGLADLIVDGIKALFIPEKDLSDEVDRARAKYEGKFPFNFGEAVSGLTASGPPAASDGGGGCPAWDVKIAGEKWSSVCDSSFTTAVRQSRPFLLAAFMATAFMPFVRSIFYASVPLIKPVPIGGDK